ncbi:hypothetical protein MB46_02685 [Arthrobacter alpinus]|uniref:choice-of-anchor G family protein n=1 Tax=Arthrobacter alpinus TaxID=656366 RepID=UPI0005CA1C17|nr:choice-of-anchor G family protein [Arthrobacter alpinus]ALV44587.1 hypothetical protein MB46_02685 [Arthrobacter alpinus]
MKFPPLKERKALNARKALRQLRHHLTRPRRVIFVASMAAIAVAASTTLTQAAWTDNEWAHSNVGTALVGDCTSNTLFQNRAWGRQLTGMVAGINLDTLAGVDGVTVSNNGTLGSAVPASAAEVTPPGDTSTYIAKLPVGVLGAQNPLITAALGLGVPVGGLGTYTQWGQAKGNGLAHGAAGLVSDQSGAVDVAGTANGSASAPKAASINLDALLPAALAGVSLDIGAVASEAKMNSCEMISGWPQFDSTPTVIRNYGIAGLDLNARVPAVGALSTSGATLVNAVPGTLNGLAGTGGLSTAITDGVIALLNPLLGTLGLGSVSTTTTLSAPNLSAVTAMMTESMTDPDGVLTINLGTGTVRANIATLMGGASGLNNLGPNHEVVLDAVTVNALTAKLTVMLDSWKNRVLAAVQQALWAVTISSNTNITLKLLSANVATIGMKVGPTSVGQLLGQPVATPPAPPPPPVVTANVLGLDIGGVVAALLTPLTNALLGGGNGVVATALNATVFGTGSLVSALGVSLAALTAPVVTALGAILSPLSSLVSLRINVQPDQPWGGSTSKPADVTALPSGPGTTAEYKVSAIRIGLINQANLLGLSLANSSAGPAKLHP